MSNRKPLASPAQPLEGPLALGGFALRLRDAVGQNRHVRAHCACGRNGPVYVDYWMSRGWGDRRLADLDDRVRCVCAGRRVRLLAVMGAAWPGDIFYQPV